MARTMMTCRVCGKEYEACRSANVGTFRWQEVACSLECGTEYLRRIEESRNKVQATPILAKKERHRKIADSDLLPTMDDTSADSVIEDDGTEASD